MKLKRKGVSPWRNGVGKVRGLGARSVDKVSMVNFQERRTEQTFSLNRETTPSSSISPTHTSTRPSPLPETIANYSDNDLTMRTENVTVRATRTLFKRNVS